MAFISTGAISYDTGIGTIPYVININTFPYGIKISNFPYGISIGNIPYVISIGNIPYVTVTGTCSVWHWHHTSVACVALPSACQHFSDVNINTHKSYNTGNTKTHVCMI